MQLPQIINSLLENDMYKFSMGQCIYHQFSAYKTTWTFKCRNTDVFFTSEMVEEIKALILLYTSVPSSGRPLKNTTATGNDKTADKISDTGCDHWMPRSPKKAVRIRRAGI